MRSIGTRRESELGTMERKWKRRKIINEQHSKSVSKDRFFRKLENWGRNKKKGIQNHCFFFSVSAKF